jgi:hypothetical protein
MAKEKSIEQEIKDTEAEIKTDVVRKFYVKDGKAYAETHVVQEMPQKMFLFGYRTRELGLNKIANDLSRVDEELIKRKNKTEKELKEELDASISELEMMKERMKEEKRVIKVILKEMDDTIRAIKETNPMVWSEYEKTLTETIKEEPKTEAVVEGA